MAVRWDGFRGTRSAAVALACGLVGASIAVAAPGCSLSNTMDPTSVEAGVGGSRPVILLPGLGGGAGQADLGGAGGGPGLDGCSAPAASCTTSCSVDTTSPEFKAVVEVCDHGVLVCP